MILGHGADPNVTDETGVTPLHRAADYDAVEVVKLLLGHGADPNATDETGMAPLHRAADYDAVEVVKLLLGHGADPNATDGADYAPLHHAIGNNAELVKALLEHGADPNAETGFFETPLFLALAQNDSESVKLLLAHGVDLELMEDDLLDWAAKEDVDEVAKLLLANARGEFDRRLWPWAVGNNAELVKALLEHGADPNAELGFFETPLSLALAQNDSESVKLLLAHGADLELMEDDLLDWAAKEDVDEVAKLLLANARGEPDRSLLHWAVGNNTELVKALLVHGADPNAKNERVKKTPLPLLSWGVEKTPLFLALAQDDSESVKLLLAHGADLELMEDDFLDWAAGEDVDEVAKLLLANARGESDRSLLHWAVGSNTELVKALLVHGADPNAKNERVEKTPLSLALAQNDSESVKLLLAHGADLEPMEDDFLDWAAGEDVDEVAKLLLAHGADPNANERRSPMRNEKNMHTLDDFAAFLKEAEHPAANFPVFFQMSVQNPEFAITLCDALIDSEKQPLFYIARGHVHQFVEAYDAAIADYDAFLTDAAASDLPAFPFAMAHFQKGICYLSLEDNDTAKISFETAIELNPHVFAYAHEMRADLQAVAQALDAGTAPPEIAASPGIRDMIEKIQILQEKEVAKEIEKVRKQAY